MSSRDDIVVCQCWPCSWCCILCSAGKNVKVLIVMNQDVCMHRLLTKYTPICLQVDTHFNIILLVKMINLVSSYIANIVLWTKSRGLKLVPNKPKSIPLNTRLKNVFKTKIGHIYHTFYNLGLMDW